MSGRFKFIIFIIFIIVLIFIARLFELQILGRDFYISKEKRIEDIPAERGEILIKEEDQFYPLAINTTRYDLIASPVNIKEGEIKNWINQMIELDVLDIKEKISENGNHPLILEENQDNIKIKEMIERLSKKGDYYELIKKDLTKRKVEEIKSNNVKGIFFEPKTKRYYPENNLFSHVTGFLGYNAGNPQGQYGVEEFLNDKLTGKPGKRELSLAAGEKDFLASKIKKAPKDGKDAILTLDHSIQFFTCSLLKESINKYKADTGSIIVMDPKTGSILSMCNQPDFNPNQYSKVKDLKTLKNNSIAFAFEPGSIFKPLTMASAIDQGVVEAETTFFDPGEIKVEDFTISNVKNRRFGRVDMTEVLEKSINTGIIFAAKKLGKQNFRNYLKKFGFGSLTGIALAGEEGGDISNLDKISKTYFYTASYGHGISATPLQIISAFNAIANSGKLIKPRIVAGFRSNNQLDLNDPKLIRQVIKTKSANIVSAMMVSVVKNGYGKKAGLKGYNIAGKTGTALIPKKGEREYSDKVIHSFIGFAPAENPRFTALITLRNPKTEDFSDATAAPTFGKLAEFILDYFNVPPTQK